MRCIAMDSTIRPINLFRGWPNPSLLPVQDLTTASTIALSTPSIYTDGLQYGPDAGYHPLRQHMAEWLTSFYQPQDHVSEDRICITGGASQNLANILQVFTDPAFTRTIWMVTPTYHLACRIFDDAGFAGRLRGIPEDEEGIDLPFLERELAKLETEAVAEESVRREYKSRRPWRKLYKFVIYATPTFANPSMKIMSLHRREGLVRLARRYDALIITDDVYDFLQWPSAPDATLPHPDRAPMARLVDVDRYLDNGPAHEWGNAVSNGSFSKIIAPGIRTGWTESTAKFAYGLSQVGSSRSGGAPSQMSAIFIDQMVSSSALRSHIIDILQPAYCARYHSVLSAIREDLLPLGFSLPPNSHEVAGGYFIWLHLPQPLQASDLARRAMEEENLQIAAGPIFVVQGDSTGIYGNFEEYVRISFAWEDSKNLTEGVRRLASTAWRAIRGQEADHQN